MTYASASDAALYCPEIVGADEEFTDTTKPTRSQVGRFLAKGYSVINSRLTGKGYCVPVSSGADAYEHVVDLEALYAASRAHLARMSARLGPNERGKAQVLMEEFNRGLDALLEYDLTRAGVSRSSAGKFYIGGISEADKKTYEDDTDRVAPRFERDQFRYEGTQHPGGGYEDQEG